MYKGHWIHSLLYFEFIELTLFIEIFGSIVLQQSYDETEKQNTGKYV